MFWAAVAGYCHGASPRGRSSRHPRRGRRYRCGRISARAEQPTAPETASAATTAHLRAGGAAPTRTRRERRGAGASPRGRSSRYAGHDSSPSRGRISARAEQPARTPSSRRTHRAHLRAGGAAQAAQARLGQHTGASPRGRSSHRGAARVGRDAGRISARAEQPGTARSRRRRCGAHLRAGGAAVLCVIRRTSTSGASPRGRSSRRHVHLRHDRGRRISARAEQPTRSSRPWPPARAHLRAGGAAQPIRTAEATRHGASPRGRSSHPDGCHSLQSLGRISARAEQPRSPASMPAARAAHLRAGGAALLALARPVVAFGASPRGRSSHRAGGLEQDRLGRISARAEQPREFRMIARSVRAHLRAGGAAAFTASMARRVRGASPRGRSSHCRRLGTSPPTGAHLRAGGAAAFVETAFGEKRGASPRGRSSRPCAPRPPPTLGRISARAEQPAAASSPTPTGRAHLRAGGAAGVWRYLGGAP